MKIFGTNERLIIQDEPDSDGELLITMPILGGDISCVDTWINRDQAIDLMKHLQDCFGI
jgi:hypothetical protein